MGGNSSLDATRHNATRDGHIAPTAHYTAHVWKRLGMPYAELFATREGAVLFWTMRVTFEWMTFTSRRVPSMVQYLAVRHRLMEHALDAYGPDRIVELGAGLSRRGLTWAADRGVRYVEVDLPHMVAAKRERLAAAPQEVRAKVGDRLEVVSQDITAPDFAAWLGATLRGAARPAVVSEGVLSYFQHDARSRLCGAINDGLAAAGGGIFVCDLHEVMGGPLMRAAAAGLRGSIRLITRGRGVGPAYRDEGEARAMLLDAGFGEARPLDPALLPDLAHVQSASRIWQAQARRGDAA